MTALFALVVALVALALSAFVFLRAAAKIYTLECCVQYLYARVNAQEARLRAAEEACPDTSDTKPTLQ
jgi:cell division protein FtsL